MSTAFTDRQQIEESQQIYWYEHDQLSITLTPQQWQTIRCALLCHTCDSRDGKATKNDVWADRVWEAHQALKSAMGA